MEPKEPLKILLLAALLLLLSITAAYADDQVVVSTNDSGNGSLRQAIANVHDGGTITFDLTYPATITLTSGELAFDRSLTLNGPGANDLAISGNDSSRVFRIVTGTVAISGLTISHGRTTGAPAQGGGILNAGNLALQQVTVTANRAEGDGGESPRNAHGGGIDNQGALTITACTISDNVAQGGEGEYFFSRGGGAYGGGIHHSPGSGQLVIENSLLRDNVARAGDSIGHGGDAQGGAICMARDAGGGTIRSSEISTNTAQGGSGSSTLRDGGPATAGGVYNGSMLLIENTVLLHNSAQGGKGARRGGDVAGGGVSSSGTLTMTYSTLDHNTAQGGYGGLETSYALGGGLFNDLDQIANIEASTISSNVAKGGSKSGGPTGPAHGGGFYSGTEDGDSSTLVFANCTISGNSAGTGGTGLGGGGALAASTATAKLSFCTIAGNSAGDKGGGLYSAATGESTGPIIKNTIIGDNEASQGPDIYQNIQSRGYNLVEDTSGGTLDATGAGSTAEGNITGQDPKLGPLQDNGGPPVGFGGSTWTQSLLGGTAPSPAIDAGSPTDIDGGNVSVDQRGFGRPAPSGGRHDMGAYEYRLRFFLPLVLKSGAD